MKPVIKMDYIIKNLYICELKRVDGGIKSLYDYVIDIDQTLDLTFFIEKYATWLKL